MPYFWGEGRHSCAASPGARRHGDELSAADAERDRKSLYRGPEPCLPEHLAGFHVPRTKRAAQVAGKRDVAASGQDACQEPCTLLMAPHLFHRPDVKRGEL